MSSNGASSDVAATGLVPEDRGVPVIFRRRLGARFGWQRAMAADGHLLLVLHAVPQEDRPERTGRLFRRSDPGERKASLRQL